VSSRAGLDAVEKREILLLAEILVDQPKDNILRSEPVLQKRKSRRGSRYCTTFITKAYYENYLYKIKAELISQRRSVLGKIKCSSTKEITETKGSSKH
jgi:hypothetical protein